jgi:cytochrome c oxidase subunit 2
MTPLPLLRALSLALPEPPDPGWGLPHDISLDGEKIDSLLHTTTFFVVLLFVIMLVWMLYAMIFHGRKHAASSERGDSKKAMMTTVGLAVLMFFVVDGNLFYNAIHDLKTAFWNFEEVNQRPDVVRIEVNAHQWAWDFRYAGSDGKFNTADDLIRLNDIRIPVNTPVYLQIASTDVIHSFYMPNFRVKIDAMPGMVNHLWFQAKETGEFEIGCAQHCGPNHYKMKANLTVLPKAEWEAWLKQGSEVGARAFDPADEKGHWGWDFTTEWNRRIGKAGAST